jgi:hypothetical protein
LADAPFSLRRPETFFQSFIGRGRRDPAYRRVPTREYFQHHRFPNDPRSLLMYALLSLMRKGDKKMLTQIFGTPSADTLQEHLAAVLRRLGIDPREMLTESVEALQAFAKALLPDVSVDNPVEGWYNAGAAYVEAAFATGPKQEINADGDISALRLTDEMSRALTKSPRLFLAAAAGRDLVKACHLRAAGSNAAFWSSHADVHQRSPHTRHRAGGRANDCERHGRRVEGSGAVATTARGHTTTL